MSNFGTVVGIGGSGNLFATNELPVDMHRKTMTGFPALTPITSILTRLGEDKAHQFRIDWQEEKEVPDILTVATDEASAGSTTVVVTAYASAVPNNSGLFNTRTQDIRAFTSQTSNSMTVVISQQGTTSSAIWKSGDTIRVLPPTIIEDQHQTNDPVSVKDSNVYNYQQLVRLEYSMTRMANASTTEFGGPGSKRASLKAQKYREFRKKWENGIYYGGRATTGSAPSEERSAGGLRHFLASGTLYKDFNGVITESGWDELLLNYHEENPDVMEIDAFISPAVRQKISYFGKPKIRISPTSKKYGLNLTQYVGPLNVNLISLPLMNDVETRGWGFLLDMSRIRLKNLIPPAFHPDTYNVGESERIYDLYRVAYSLLIANENKHAMFVGAKL